MENVFILKEGAWFLFVGTPPPSRKTLSTAPGTLQRITCNALRAGGSQGKTSSKLKDPYEKPQTDCQIARLPSTGQTYRKLEMAITRRPCHRF